MRIRIEGGHPLRGTYRPGGNSNAALLLIAASLLTDRPVTLTGVPETLSVGSMLEVAEALGTQVVWENGTLRLETPAIPTRALTRQMTEAKVGVALFMAVVLVRRGHARLEVDYPLSRLHTHLTALRDLGCRVTVGDGVVEASLTPYERRGERREIILTQTSVTATAMVAMLAAAQPGETILHNAASEPHVQALLRLLQAMGAEVVGVGSNLIGVRGREGLRGATQAIGPDHIEVASVAAIGALTGGRLDIEGIRAADLRLIEKVYARLGIRLDVDEDRVHVPRHEAFQISSREEEVDVSIETAPWPGFPSDLAAMATVAATQAHGTILIHEKLFDNRLLFVDKLNRLGAQIVLCDPHRAVVVGPTPLHADYLDTPDVRTGLAMLGAALCAQGESVMDGAELLEWNFEGVLPKLQALGAKITVLDR